jgi:hypothetical protein
MDEALLVLKHPAYRLGLNPVVAPIEYFEISTEGFRVGSGVPDDPRLATMAALLVDAPTETKEFDPVNAPDPSVVATPTLPLASTPAIFASNLAGYVLSFAMALLGYSVKVLI